MPSFGDVVGSDTNLMPQITEDNRYVIYLADQQTDHVRNLYSVALDVSGQPEPLITTLMSADRSILEFKVSADSRRLVYVADQESSDVYELYCTYDDGGTIFLYMPAITQGGQE